MRNVRKYLVISAVAMSVAAASLSGCGASGGSTEAVGTETAAADISAAETTAATTEAPKETEAEKEETSAEATEAASEETSTEAETTAEETTEEAATEAAAENPYAFVYNQVSMAMGAEAETALAALGEPQSTFEQDSCAYQGKDIVYSYPGFELSTYPVDGKEHISSVYLLDDTVSTVQGIHIGSTEDEVKAAYPDAVEEFGVYRTGDEAAELSVYLTDGVVDAIEYVIKVVE